jgi:uncharacterized membrane protein (GlpM family)
MKWQDSFPVIVSILVILLVAILERHSKLAAAVTATMPLSAPLALWIVHNAARGEPAVVIRFSLGLLLGIIPTIAFLTVVWIASRRGYRLETLLILGYAAWGVFAAALFAARRVVGL